MNFSATDVKNLREKTGAGMMECKRALSESAGDMEKAFECLRKRGLSIAAKKSGREASEGIIGAWLSPDHRVGALVEVNCETDFVARNQDFQSFVATVTELVASQNPSDLDALKGLNAGNQKLSDLLTSTIAKIGENLEVSRFLRLSVEGTRFLTQYLHAGSKIGVMVDIDDPSSMLKEQHTREVAMHIAAMNPGFLRRDDIPSAVLEKEKEILKAQMAGEKKPEDLLEKIVVGKLNKFYKENCLEEQLFVCDPEGKKSVGEALKGIDPKIQIQQFVRFQVGEGSGGATKV